MDDKDMFWLAGLLEGEGSFLKPAPSEPKYPRIIFPSSDEDIAQRVAKLFEVNYIYRRESRHPNWKPECNVSVKGKRAASIMGLLYPLMGERRKRQIEAAVGETPKIENQFGEASWFYWLVGYLEGEGSFIQATQKRPTKPAIRISSTDGDVLHRAAKMLSVKCFGPYKVPAIENNRKDRYLVNVSGRKAIRLMEQLRPHMGERRQAQIDAVLASYQVKGHPQGDTHPQAKLTAGKVRVIKQRIREGEKLSRLAAEYEVDTGLIWQIKAGRIWRQVE